MLAALLSCAPVDSIARLAGGPADAASAEAGTGAAFGGGVNLAGAEFAPTVLPGTYQVDYEYPTHGEVDHFFTRGARVFRLPVLWERVQPALGAALDATELARVDDFVSYTTASGARVVLDLHSFGAYRGLVVGVAPSAPPSAFADVWSRLAQHFSGNDRVLFGLSSAPLGTQPATWLGVANAAIAAIRKTGAMNLVLVPGGGAADASLWDAAGDGGASSNAATMLGVVDPASNYVYQLSQFLDGDGSGTSGTCVSATIGSDRLQTVIAWLRTNKQRGFLAEFGAGSDATCLAAISDLLAAVDASREVWVGWTYWAGGPLWGAYPLSIEPANGVDAPQLAAIAGYF